MNSTTIIKNIISELSTLEAIREEHITLQSLRNFNESNNSKNVLNLMTNIKLYLSKLEKAINTLSDENRDLKAELKIIHLTPIDDVFSSFTIIDDKSNIKSSLYNIIKNEKIKYLEDTSTKDFFKKRGIGPKKLALIAILLKRYSINSDKICLNLNKFEKNEFNKSLSELKDRITFN